MSNIETHEINTNIPSASRVYDYTLGGNHNFEADRQAAEYMFSLLPSTGKWVRLLRTFLQEAAAVLGQEGFDKFLDLGSGLPTVDHIHAIVPNARVIYTDIDPITVAYGQELLKGNPNARMIEADVRNIDALLNSPAVAELFGDDRQVVIGMNGMTCFFTEEELQHLFTTLYDWAAPGSKLFCTFETKNPNLTEAGLEAFVDMFAKMGSPYYFLTAAQSKELIKPWRIDGDRYKTITDWLGAPELITEADRAGVELEFYGAILVK
ncbi:MAG: SAM-dependent methyltransferase [Chloroflexi bacterium]|nr:SAM-dependent methyltransferase [Chloroflexota bacterium]